MRWHCSPDTGFEIRPSTLPLGHRGSPQYWVMAHIYKSCYMVESSREVMNVQQKNVLVETRLNVMGWQDKRKTKIYLPYAGLMLGHRLRRWPNIKPAVGKCLLFAGKMRVHSRIEHFPANTRRPPNPDLHIVFDEKLITSVCALGHHSFLCLISAVWCSKKSFPYEFCTNDSFLCFFVYHCSKNIISG